MPSAKTGRGATAASGDKVYPPGEYPVVIVGSGPGALQLAYDLNRLGVRHAVISADPAPGGMFRVFPLFQRLITWSPPRLSVGDVRENYRWDWNSMVSYDPAHQSLVSEFMDRTSYFPSRAEMEQALWSFAERTGVKCRYNCTWETTRLEKDQFTLGTSDGEYHCAVAVFAVGMTEPWRPPIPGLEDVPHYVELASRPAKTYEGKKVFVIGKRNSGFEIADGLLPWARQVILGSPHPIRPSILAGVPTPPRARYLQPVEDHLFGGGTLVVDCAIERVERKAGGYAVYTEGTTRPGKMVFEVEEVIAATGFGTPLRDLPELGVKTFYANRLPTQSAFWESTTVPGVYFAGSVTQGNVGLRKYGFPSRSASVAGFRYNSRVLAQHLAEKHFGIPRERPEVPKDRVVSYLLAEATRGPEIWSQQSYLARVLTFDRSQGVRDEGVLPLAPFVDETGPDAIAITVETDPDKDIHPAIYLRKENKTEEHILQGSATRQFDSAEHKAQLTSLVKRLLK